jgi:RimJ/RimL family protein N-acetyltransferase
VSGAPEPAVTLRIALPADATALAAFAARAFTEAYGPANDPADVALHIAETYTPALQARELSDPACCCWLALAGSAIAGYLLLRQGPAPACVTGPAPREIARYYVGAHWHGRGVAQALLAAAARTAWQQGARTLWLTAWEQSAQSQRYYAKAGFVPVGTATFVLGRARQTDRVLERALSAP